MKNGGRWQIPDEAIKPEDGRISSGLNNLSVNSIMDEDYSQFFGFTSSEVYEMLHYYGMTDKMEELKEWYDGYLFGNEEIYNPWSVINCVSIGLLLVAGYLKTPKKELQPDGSYLCEVSVLNKEIAAVYKNEILFHLMQIGAITRTTANKIAESLKVNLDIF